jgi:hypothetical protein
MLRRMPQTILVYAMMFLAIPRAFATTVTIHTEDARRTLLAMQNPALTHDEAMTIAQMHGNQGILRKLHEFKVPVNTEDFANALYATAHGQVVTKATEKDIYLDTLQPKVPQLLALLDEIEANPETFQKAIEHRIAMFTPPGADLHLEGYIVAGGDGGGYAFGDTDFFLNIGFMDDLILAKSTTMHEMYHAVQGAYATARELKVDAGSKRSRGTSANVERLFANLYEEGSAMYVGDIPLLPQSHSPAAARMLADINDGMSHIQNSATLLEMSVIGLTAADPVPYDDLYSVGFLGHGVLYDIAYEMAKAIAEEDGPQGLTAFLTQPPCRFVLRYTRLPAYGKDKDHPRLGPHTIASASVCK